MFFKKLYRELLSLNLMNLLFFLTVFSFLRFSDGFSLCELTFPFSDKMVPIVFPYAFLYFFVTEIIVSRAICKLFNINCLPQHYFMVFLTGMLFMVLYLIVVIVLWSVFRDVSLSVMTHSLTEKSFWVIAVVFLCVLIIALKLMTLARLLLRLQYFSVFTNRNLVNTSWIRSSFGGILKKGLVVRFLVTSSFAAGTPLVVFLAGYSLSDMFLTVLSLMLALVLYSSGKLMVIYVIWKYLFFDNSKTEEDDEDLLLASEQKKEG
jgi:hypothetical protein